MLIPNQTGGMIQTNAIREVRASPDGTEGVAIAVMADGSEHRLIFDVGELLSLGGTPLGANPGFTKLIYYFADGGVEERHPVIGWRVYGHSLPTPITPLHEGLVLGDCREGILYPDGKVASAEGTLFPDYSGWLAQAKLARVDWLRGQDSPLGEIQ